MTLVGRAQMIVGQQLAITLSANIAMLKGIFCMDGFGWRNEAIVDHH